MRREKRKFAFISETIHCFNITIVASERRTELAHYSEDAPWCNGCYGSNIMHLCARYIDSKPLMLQFRYENAWAGISKLY